MGWVAKVDGSNGQIVDLLFFSNLSEERDSVDGGRHRETALYPPSSGCVVTLLRKFDNGQTGNEGGVDQALSDNRTDDVSPRFISAFWEDNAVKRKAIAVLTDGLRDCSLWMIGKYSSDDIVTMERHGIVPREMSEAVPQSERSAGMGGYRSKFMLLLPVPDARLAIFPCTQALGHGEGAALLVFERNTEPRHIYDSLLHTFADTTGSPGLLNVEIDSVLANPIAWLAPFGQEDGNHAIMGRHGLHAEQIATRLARSLELSMFRSVCGQSEFRRWEWDHTLPKDVREEIERLGRNPPSTRSGLNR